LMRMTRERDVLVQKRQVERQEYLQKLDETLEEKESILAQRNALQAQIDGLRATIVTLQQQQHVTAVDLEKVEQYKHEWSVMEQRYTLLVAGLKRQVRSFFCWLFCDLVFCTSLKSSKSLSLLLDHCSLPKHWPSLVTKSR
jgi:predicted nuclease with TOPRIM domain